MWQVSYAKEAGRTRWGWRIWLGPDRKGLTGRGTMAGEPLTILGHGGVSTWGRCGVYFEKSTMASGRRLGWIRERVKWSWQCPQGQRGGRIWDNDARRQTDRSCRWGVCRVWAKETKSGSLSGFLSSWWSVVPFTPLWGNCNYFPQTQLFSSWSFSGNLRTPRTQAVSRLWD